MLASGRESEGNEGAEKRIPSVPLGMRRGREGRGKKSAYFYQNVDKTDEQQPGVRVSNSLLAEKQRNC